MSVAYDWIAHHARRTPSKIAIEDTFCARAKSYRDFDSRIEQLASGLRSRRGIGRGDRIAALASNCSELFELQFACGRLGAIFVPLNVRLLSSELRSIVEDLDPALIVHDGERRAVAQQLSGTSGRSTLCELGEGGDFEALIAEHAALGANETVTHDDVSTIIYTSGTTGAPKGTLITHGMTFWHAINIASPAGISSSSVGLVLLPMCHSAGLNLYANPIFNCGGTVKVAGTFNADETLELLDATERPVTHIFAVPTVYQLIAERPGFNSVRLDRIETAGVGGAPAPSSLLQTWQARGLALQQGYGMTEAGPSMLVMDHSDAIRKAASVGKGVMHMELRVVDGGRIVTPGQIGELQARGPSITPGYWGQPDATRQLFDDGWLKTGDLVEVDDEGFFHIVGRSKEIYISGGVNIHPSEVERALQGHPEVAEVAVIGIADKIWGEAGIGFVTLTSTATADSDSIAAYCRQHLAPFKCPKSIMILDAMPRNVLGKIERSKLRRLVERAA